MAGNATNTASSIKGIADSDDRDNDRLKGAPYRLRNHSYQQANANSMQSNVAIDTQTILEEDKAGAESSELEKEKDSVMGSMEDMITEKLLLRREDWQGKNTNFKLDSVFEAVNKMYLMHVQCLERIKPLEYAVFNPQGGILPQLTTITTHAKATQDKQTTLEGENAQLRDELDIVKGVVSKQGKQILELQHKLADQTARSMSDSIVISGLLGDSKTADQLESTSIAAAFLEETMQLSFEPEDLITAYRLGRFDTERSRPIVIKVVPSLVRKIFANTTILADKRNAKNQRYSVNPLLPDSLAEQRREIRKIIKDKKDLEKGLPQQQKSNFLVRSGKVYINGQLQRKLVKPPEFKHLFVDEEEQLRINKIKTKTVEEKPIRGSKFKAVAVITPKLNDVHLAYIKMFQLYPHADHIIVGYSAEGTSGFHDNGEFGAGHRVLGVIENLHLSEVSVFVIREYGGEHLGPARFNIIKDLTAKALEALG